MQRNMDRSILERARTAPIDKRLQSKNFNLSETETGCSSDNEKKPKKVTLKNDRMNQSTSAMMDPKGKRCSVCLKKEPFFSKFPKCSVCSELVCGSHSKRVIDKKPVCDACYKRVVVDTRRNFRDENMEVLRKLKDQLEALVIKRDELMSKRLSLSRKQADREDAVKRRRQQYLQEEEDEQRRCFKEETRNDSVQRQLTTMMQAYEDAKNSELDTSKRLADQLAIIDGLKTEQTFISQQNAQLTSQLAKTNSNMARLLNPFKFFEVACRPCKAKFAKKFRSELLRDKVDVDNLSFINLKASTVSAPDPRQPDHCRCELM